MRPPRGSALAEAGRQRRRLELVDAAVGRFNAAAEAGGPRQAPAGPTPAAPSSGPLGGWGAGLLLAALAGLALYVGCTPPTGAPGRPR
jgi:hypothetical protein